MDMEDLVVVSVDDHVIEPRDMFDRHRSGEAVAIAPKLRTKAHGTNYWGYQGKGIPSFGPHAAVGRPREEYGMEPSTPLPLTFTPKSWKGVREGPPLPEESYCRA